MKFISRLENLKHGLNQTTHLAGRNQNLPILNNVLLEAKGGSVIFSTTNLEIGIKTTIRGKVEEEGAVTIPARLLNDFIQQIKSENVEIKTKENNLIINTPQSQTTIKGQDYSEFPLIPEIEKKENLDLETKTTKEALQMVLFAAAVDSARPEISGILFNITQQKLIIAATDSYRLAEKKVKIKDKTTIEQKVIIPSFTLQELNRILSDHPQEQLKMYLSDNQILFEIEGTSIISRITEGEYPDYEQVIPKNSSTTTEINRQELQQAVKATSLFCRQGINDISLEVKENNLEIKALNDQVGENKIIIPTKTTGDDNFIVFNYHYLLDVLNALKEEQIVLQINNSNLPGLIRAKGDEEYVYIIMPIKQ